MPQDEPPDEERPRVYGTEDGDLGRPDKPDIVGDDKADVSRMADDEVVKTEPSTSAAHHHSSNKGTRTTANVQVPIFNGSLFGGGRNYKTAFNTVSPSYITVHPQAQMLQQFAAAQQYYNGLNGFWCTRAPFASPPVASLTSPSLSSPTYGAAVNGIGVYSSPHSWFSAFQLDAAAKAGFIYAPMVTAQMSPSFPSAMDQLHLRQMELAAFSARMESPFIPSPLHSPESGAPIVSLGTKVPVPSFTAVKLAMPNAAGGCSNAINAGLGLSPSYVHYPSHPNPLLSMRQILVPPVTTTVTGVAASSLLPPSFNGMSGCGNPIIIGGSMPTVADCRQAAASTSDKPSSNVFDAATSSGVKRPLDANGHHHLSSRQNNNGHHHQHNHNSVQSATSSTVQRHKDCSSSKKQHIKKPLNAFMLYMKEMRPSVMQEAGLKERQSAEINRILGRRWHSLTRDEQQKYYEMAKKERQEHLRKYPSWSARDNYAIHKKKKRKRDKAQDNLEAKKCRARFGLDQQLKWCKHCRRKKKCLWFKDGDGENSNDAADASPAAQVTSTSQDDFQLHSISISVDSLSTCPSAINNSNNDSTVHQPLVTSTTTSVHRNNESGDVAVSKKASADARIDSDCEADSDSDSSVGDEVTFSDDDFSERLTASPRSSSTTDDIRVDDPADQTPTVVNLVVDACAKGET